MATIPAVSFIEMAIDSVKDPDGDPTRFLVFDAEVKELRALGQARLDAYAASLPADLTDLERGYLLRGAVDRILLQGMPSAAAAGVEL